MKRSKKIVLAIIASATLTACGSSTQPTQRDVYANKEKCAEEWGDNNCEEATGSGGRTYSGPHYFIRSGYPYYYPRGGADPDPVRASAVPRFHGVSGYSPSGRASHTVASSISRGGFGSFFRGGS